MAAPRATMDFFAAQAAAKRRTAVLVVWFALAWAGTVALVFVLLGLLLQLGLSGGGVVVDGGLVGTGLALERGLAGGGLRGLAFTPAGLGVVAAAVTLVTVAGSAFHWAALAKDGPHAIARLVGGVPVRRDTRDEAERRLVNVVEEMAIAAGIPVPALYVLPGEAGINAFAAGFTADRGVVAVTRGALDGLTRDELQGVVAHEFSHLLNADARLNLRLVALIGGITALAFLGRTLMRAVHAVGGGATSRRRRGGSLGFLLFAGGLALWASGSIGALFGRVIRAAVSRQREFLADAAAVQFTRNPDGLAGALAKIARQGSVVASAGAAEVSHFFFASGLRAGWLATHPPIEERIRRINPRGLPRGLAAAIPAGAEARAPERAGVAAAAAGAVAAEGAGGLDGAGGAARALTASVGHPEARHVAYAAGLLAGLPPAVAVAARAPASSAALVAALLTDPDPVSRELQLTSVANAGARAEIARLAAALGATRREDRMALLDLALPALDGLGPDAAARLVADLGALARGKTTVFEWAVQRIVRRRLAAVLGERRDPKVSAWSVEDVGVEALELLSALAWLGAPDEAGAQRALEAGAAALGMKGWRPLPRNRVRAGRLDAALARLDAAAVPLKKRLLEACAACALSDGRVFAAEGEVVRAVAASLGLPVPPLTPASRARSAGAA